jgi:hypothetical protein
VREKERRASRALRIAPQVEQEAGRGVPNEGGESGGEGKREEGRPGASIPAKTVGAIQRTLTQVQRLEVRVGRREGRLRRERLARALRELSARGVQVRVSSVLLLRAVPLLLRMRRGRRGARRRAGERA